MAPNRTAYNLYFGFYVKLHKNPSLRIDFECSRANRELYKSFVRTLLTDDTGVRPDDESGSKYAGTENFKEMSKKIGEEWSKVDKLTKSIFEDLAAEETKHHKDVRFQIDY